MSSCASSANTLKNSELVRCSVRSCVLDIETDGFFPSKIHCLCVKEVGDGTVLVFLTPRGVDEFLSKFDTVIAHNGCAYDFPALSSLWGVDIPVYKQTDTLIMSRLSRPDRKGGHSLRVWGERLGLAKQAYDLGFAMCTPELIEYCKTDVLLCDKLYQHLLRDTVNFTAKSIRSEHRMQILANKVEKAGFAFDLERGYKLYSKLIKKQKSIALKMQDVFPDSVVQMKTKVKLVPFNPASRKQIGERLQERGWKPKMFTETGLPKIDENTLSDCKIPEAQVLAEYFMLQKRTGMLDSWIQGCSSDLRVHCNFHPLGAVTNRMSSSSPNLQQIPSMRKPLGHECRELWVAEPGHVLVDTDAKSLELRVLAHYMNDAAYTREVLEGDIHTTNQKMAGLPTRDTAKVFIYALLYGAGDAKLGTIVEGTAADGKALRERFLANLPAFTKLRSAVILKGTQRHRLKGIDGRILHVRHPHASLNTLIQGSSAILMKSWFMRTDGKLPDGAKIVAMVHDELVIEALEKDVDRVSQCAKLSLQLVNKEYNLRCKLDCDVISGNNWSEIH